jgi:hypothetical protein
MRPSASAFSLQAPPQAARECTARQCEHHPFLSANNAENQQVKVITPDFTPKNVKSGVFFLEQFGLEYKFKLSVMASINIAYPLEYPLLFCAPISHIQINH